MVRSASGPHHRTSWSFLILAPPTCGCPLSTARARPAVSARLGRGGRLAGQGTDTLWGRAALHKDCWGELQSQRGPGTCPGSCGTCPSQREEAGHGAGWPLCLPCSQIHIPSPTPARPSPLHSVLFALGNAIPSHSTLQHSFYATPPHLLSSY